MFFIRLFLANTWEKNRGSPCLFPHKLLWKVDMVLRSQSRWIICTAGTGARNKITPIVFEVCTRDQACFRLFLYIWYRQHRGSYLDRVQQIPWNEILELWIFILDYFVSLAFCFPRLGLDIFAFTQQCLTKKLKGKAVDRFLSCFVSIQNKLWIQLQTSCLHQRLVFLALFRRYGGSHLFDRNSSLHARSLNNIWTVAILGQTVSR